MMRYNSKKSQGRIKINTQASDKLRALFSQESDVGMVSSAAENAGNGKGDATAVLSTSYTALNEGDHADTCAGVNSLPRIVITPPPANGNEAETKYGAGKRSPPPIKLPLLPTPRPTLRPTLLRPPERVYSARLQRTPATNGKKQPTQPPLKLPLIQPQRITSASLQRKQPLLQTCRSPIIEEKEADIISDPPATASPPSSTADDQYSDDFEDDDDDNEDNHDQENQNHDQENQDHDQENLDHNQENQDHNQGYDQENQDHDDINDADNEEEDSESDDDVDDQTTRNGSNRPITGINRRTTGGTFDGKEYPPCVIPGYQRTFSGAAVISPLVKTVSAPSLGEMATLEKQLPVVVSAGLQPGLISQRRKKREPNRSQLLIQKMTSQYALTPLKMVANKLVTLHYDVHPTEISPGINRAPSFVGKEDEAFELMSGRSSPKLDIPRRRYCGLMIKQHPLVRHCYRMTDRRLARVIKRQLSSSSSSSSSCGPGDYDNMDGDPDDVYNPKNKSVIVKAEKKVSFSEKKPISCKPAKDSKPLVLMPTPPSQCRPASSQATLLRAMRKARMEKRQQQTKTSTMAKKQ